MKFSPTQLDRLVPVLRLIEEHARTRLLEPEREVEDKVEEAS